MIFFIALQSEIHVRSCVVLQLNDANDLSAVIGSLTKVHHVNY